MDAGNSWNDEHVCQNSSNKLKEVPGEIKEAMLKDYDIVPLQEAKLKDIFINNHSLMTNEVLRERWKQRLSQGYSGSHSRKPFILPQKQYFHFVKEKIEYDPSQSITEESNVRYRLRLGPGRVELGERPIQARTKPKNGRTTKSSNASIRNGVTNKPQTNASAVQRKYLQNITNEPRKKAKRPKITDNEPYGTTECREKPNKPIHAIDKT